MTRATPFVGGPGTLSEIAARLPVAARITAAVPYVTDPLAFNWKEGDQLYVDCSVGTVKSGGTNPRLLRQLVKRGVTVMHCRDLHAKVIIAGRWTVVGSVNLSKRADLVHEAAWMGTDKAVRDEALDFFDQLSDIAVEVDADWLRAKEPFFATDRLTHTPTREPWERRPRSILPVKVTRLHLAYGYDVKETPPGHSAVGVPAISPTARFQGTFGKWDGPGIDLKVGDLLVWVAEPDGQVAMGVDAAAVGVMDVPLLVTARPSHRGERTDWFLAEGDTYLEPTAVPPLRPALARQLKSDGRVTLTRRQDVDAVLSAWGLSSAPAPESLVTVSTGRPRTRRA